MSTKPNVPNFTRQPAKQVSLEKRLEAVTTLNAELIQLIGRHFPAMGQELTKLTQSFGQSMSQIDALEGELVLRGHGARGAVLSQGIKTAEDNEAFIAQTLNPSETPLSFDELVATLQSYLTIDIMGEQGMTKSWVMPETNMYGQLVRDGGKQVGVDLMTLPEGIYVVREEKRAFYTLKIDLDDSVLVFSPNSGPSIVTYSEIEQSWVQHNAWNFVNGPKALAKIAEFFSKTNVRDITASEFKKLDTTLRSNSVELFGGIVEADADGTLNVKLNDLYSIRLTASGEGSVVGVRDDLPWSDLTLFTRRQMYRELTQFITQASTPAVEEAPAPMEAPATSAEAVEAVDVTPASDETAATTEA